MTRDKPSFCSVVLHAHFYQPPRDEPWLEEIEREPTAAPYHDWNQRIERECYRAVVAARVPAPDGRIAKVVNTLEAISFNVGTTLAEWLEREAPETWTRILAADQASRLNRRGHGNALAMPYHHVILPLATRRDKSTEIRWGIADFRRRFGREPEGMWLPETAVDDETLDVLAEEEIRFTVLAPHQVRTPPPGGLPGRYTTSSGKTIALFVYDGSLSHDVAFGPLLKDAARWTEALQARRQSPAAPALISMATDGETFGHHHQFGEMALAAMLERLTRDSGLQADNFASFLAQHPAEHPVELVAPSSWSCPHGVGRWSADCGCRLESGTTQAWRKPLREALDWLAGELHTRFEAEGAAFFPDPWAARDAYGVVGSPSHFPVRARELLEMERLVLRMFTSDAWFFDDVARLEAVMSLRSAARALELAGPARAGLEAELRRRLAEAPGNDPVKGNGRDVYDRSARPAHPGEVRAAAAYAAVAEIAPERLRTAVGAYLIGPTDDQRLLVQHRRTGRTWRVAARVEREGRIGVTVSLSVEGEDPTYRIGLAELPETEREAIRRTLRQALREGVLSREDEARIAEGVVTYRRAVADSLIRQLPVDPNAAGSLELVRLEWTLDLLEVDGLSVPFDAQSRFYRLLEEGPSVLQPALRAFAGRFGFVPPR